MVTIACSSWGEFKGRLLRYAALSREVRDAHIFRGHRDSNWKLESTQDRQFAALSASDRAIKPKRLLSEFANELYGPESKEVFEDSEVLELLGRHHGLPTTVLDWSRSPYVASYFAFEGAEVPASREVAIWSFDRRTLSKSSVAADVVIDDMSLIGDDVFVEKFDLPKADEDLIREYRDVGVTVDALAYTPEFDHLFERYLSAGHQATKRDVFRRLQILRKSGLLPRLFRSTMSRVETGLANAG